MADSPHHYASKCDRLPAAIRGAIARQVEEGRTIDEINQFLAQHGFQISRSALGKHTAEIHRHRDRLMTARAVAGKVIDELGPDDHKQAMLVGELVMTALYEVMAKDEQMGPLELKQLADAFRALVQAQKGNVDYVRQIEARAAEKARREAGEATVKALAAEGGISPATLTRIRREIYGLDG